MILFIAMHWMTSWLGLGTSWTRGHMKHGWETLDTVGEVAWAFSLKEKEKNDFCCGQRTEIRGSLRGPREPKNEVKQDQGQKTLPIKGDDKGCCHREVNTASMQENYWRHRQALEQVIHRMCLRGIGGASAIACLSYSQQMSHLRVLILAMCTSKCVSTGPWVVFRFNKPIGVEPKSVTHQNRLSHSHSLDLKSHSISPLIISNNFLIFSFLNVLSGQIVEKMGLSIQKYSKPQKNSWSMLQGWLFWRLLLLLFL